MKYQSDEFERRQLQQQIRDAQELGVDCYLFNNDAAFAVQVRPQDSSEAALREIQSVEPVSFVDLEFRFDVPEDATVSCCCVLGDEPFFSEDDFAPIFETTPLSDIKSCSELAALFVEHFESDRDWRIWHSFLLQLPNELPRPIVDRLVIPLLEAGELYWVPEAAEEFLAEWGMTPTEISEVYSIEERERRTSRLQFQETTGHSVDQVTNAQSFGEILASLKRRADRFWAISYFLSAQQDTADLKQLREVVSPHIKSLGEGAFEHFERIVMQRLGCGLLTGES